MAQFRFSLQKYNGQKTRFLCPHCGRKELTRYIDNETNNFVDEQVGKCNRIEKCGYHFTPKQFFEKKGENIQYYTNKSLQIEEKPTWYADENLFLESLHSKTQTSNLYQFLIQYFDRNMVAETFRKYLVGVSKKWQNSVIFWQIDKEYKIRAGKIMQYDSVTGRRDKNKFSWIKNQNENLEMRQVFFGLHLLNYFKNNTVGIVESEKTAMLCDLFFDDKIVWLASGGLQGITERKMKDLRERTVVLFPDLSAENSKIKAYDEWKKKAKIIGENLKMNIKINTYLNFYSSGEEQNNQEDLGDFILRNIKRNMQDDAKVK